MTPMAPICFGSHRFEFVPRKAIIKNSQPVEAIKNHNLWIQTEFRVRDLIAANEELAAHRVEFVLELPLLL